MLKKALGILFFTAIFVATPLFAKNEATKPNKKQAGVTKTVDSSTAILLKLQNKIKELEGKVKKLQDQQDDMSIHQMKTDGKISNDSPNKSFRMKDFHGHSRSLQAMNPEISVTGDFAGKFVWSGGKEYNGGNRSGFDIRGVGLHIQSDLDPFSYMKAAISFSPNGVEFGEAYIVWTNVLNAMDITFGKFRQQLGVVNRWHKHGLDQYDYPLMLQEPFGEGGLNQVGISFLFLLPKITAQMNSLELQITNGMNSKAFAGKWASIPTTLLHYKNYWDLSRSTYLEFGLTGILGFNNHRGEVKSTPGKLFMDAAQTTPFNLYDNKGNPVPVTFGPQTTTVSDDPWQITAFGGADLTIQWEPINQAKYKNFLWRTEFLYGYQQLAPDKKGNKQRIHWMGGYSYVQGKISRSFEIGLRGDLVQPFALNNSKHYIFQVVPYITWYESPWAHLRLEYDYRNGDQISGSHTVLLQIVFAAGPHKHDRY